MRSFLLPIAVLVLWPMFSTCLAAEQISTDREARHAVVTSPGAPVRSGPDESYYLTDTLPEATTVEVYRRESNGWCAIRPPVDSFSWIFAPHLHMLDDGLAEISKDDVASRVGSRLSSQRDVVQVRLSAGERVAVLGRDDRDGGTWYKIAPPAGEFRWVHIRDLALDGEARSSGGEFPVKTVALEEPEGDERYSVVAPPLSSEESSGSEQGRGESASTTPPAQSPATAKLNSKWAPAKTTPPPADITPIGSGVAPSKPADGELAEHLQQLELRLSRMVAEPPATWNIAPLEQAAEQLLAYANSVADRDAVKTTLEKIDRFASIQRRYATAGLASAAADVPPTGAQPPSAVASTATPTAPNDAISKDATNSSDSAYDAVGILRPVVSRRPGAPQFALVNAQGQVVTFITPTPGVNLQPYIGQQIGVSGSRGYIPEFHRAHITAARFSPTNGRMIR